MRRLLWPLALLPLLAACGDDGAHDEVEPPDTTAPVITLELERFALLREGAEIRVAVNEPAGVRLLAGETVLAEGHTLCHASMPPICDGGPVPLFLDTSAVEDGLYRVAVVAVDDAGNETRTAEIPVIVANRGERVEVAYDPEPEVSIPVDYEGVELDVRATAASKPGIRKLITWVTWDPAADWLIEYSLGQGLCPHRGIQYLAEESRSGELVIELDRADVDPAIVAGYPVADRESDTFPVNDDPLTYGLFFGHVKPMEPAAHAGGELPIRAGLVYLYAEE